MQATDEAERIKRHIRALLAGLFILACVAAAHFAREFLLPVVLGFFIAFTFRPAIRRLSRNNVPAWLAACVFMSVVVLATLAAIYFVTVPVAAWIADAPNYARTFADRLAEFRSSFETLMRWTEKIGEIAGPAKQGATEVVVRESETFTYLLPFTGYSAGVVATLVLTLVIAGFLMASGDLFYEKLVKVLPTLSDKKRALRIVYDVEREVSAYLLIVTAINAGLGVAVGVSFFALGMPSPHLWGILAFVLNFIPYVGSIVGVTLAAFMSVITFDSLAYAALAPVIYAAWNGIENQFVTPLFLGRRLEMNAVSILLALAFWTWLWGIAGTMVAVPLLITIKIFCEHIEGLSGVSEFLSEKRSEEPADVAEEAQS